MNIGTGEPGRQMARFANGRAESTYTVSETVSPTFNVGVEAEPPTHSKRIICTTLGVVAAGAALCSVFIRIPRGLNATLVLRRLAVTYLAQAAATPLVVDFTRAYNNTGGGGAAGTIGNLLIAVDGFQEIMPQGATSYGVIPFATGAVTNNSIAGALLWRFPIVRAAAAAAQISQQYVCDYPFVFPSSPLNTGGPGFDTILQVNTALNATLNDELYATFVFDWYPRIFQPLP